MSAPKITVIGSSNIDFIMQVPTLPKLGESVSNGEFMQTFGGKGANQAVAAARAGGNVHFINHLGDDLYAPRMLQQWQTDGMDVSAVTIEPEQSCGTALVIFDTNGDNYLTVSPGANACLTPEIVQANKQALVDSAVVVLQMEIPAESVRAVLHICAEAGTTVLFNYAPATNLTVGLDTGITVLIVNETEAAALLGSPPVDHSNVAATAKALRAKGPKTVIITLGSEGAYLQDSTSAAHVAAYKVSPTDTTAAGDTFCGVLAVALTEGRTMLEAVTFASAASALCVTQIGAQPSIPKRAAIDQFIKTAKATPAQT